MFRINCKMEAEEEEGIVNWGWGGIKSADK